MDGPILEAASASWASISALAVLLLGILSFTGGRARPPGSVAFGFFAVTWALQVLVGRSMALATPETAPRAHLLFAALLLPLPYFLLQFARSFAREGATGLPWRLGTLASVAVPFGVVGLLLVDPTLVYRGAVVAQERLLPQWGPLYPYLVVLPFFAAFAVTLVTLDQARRASPTMRTATGHALLAAGLATFIAFSAGNNLSYYATDLLSTRVLPLADVYLFLFAALAVLAVALGTRAASDAWSATSAAARLPGALVAASLLVPLGWGAVEGALAYEVLPRFNTIGLWRLAGVAMLAYALARWRVPELRPRSRETAALGVGIAAAALSGGLVIGVLMLTRPQLSFILLAGFAVPLAALSPSLRLARRVLRVPAPAGQAPGALAGRVETYRAALEASLARASLEADADFLAGLRHQLEIGPDVHEALLCVAANAVPAPPDRSYPGYERLRLLGEGAHGRAWLARQRFDDALVVLKEPRDQDPGLRADLARQARLTQRLRHPNLVAIHRFVETPNGSFLVMEHVPGGSLADRLASGPLAPIEAASCIRGVLAGLHALHDAGLAHGDVKASNVLLDAGGAPRLADFGLSRQPSADATRTLLAFQGTLSAAAPEQAAGAPPTPASDLYAAGALLYRLLTGDHYLDFANLDEARARDVIRTAPPRLPHASVPGPLEDVIARALRKEPAARYADARAFLAALEEASSRL